MIIRAVLNPTVPLGSFDWFNDLGDTWAWLDRIDDRESASVACLRLMGAANSRRVTLIEDGVTSLERDVLQRFMETLVDGLENLPVELAEELIHRIGDTGDNKDSV